MPGGSVQLNLNKPNKELTKQTFPLWRVPEKTHFGCDLSILVFYLSLVLTDWLSDSNWEIVSWLLETFHGKVSWIQPKDSNLTKTDANSQACFYCWGCKLVCCPAYRICSYDPNDDILFECLHCSKHSSLAVVFFWLRTAPVCQDKMTIWWCNRLLWIVTSWIWSSNLSFQNVSVSPHLTPSLSPSPICWQLIIQTITVWTPLGWHIYTTKYRTE